MSVYKSGRPNKYAPNAKKGKEPPSEPGEYRIRIESEIAYIGTSANMKNRMNAHVKSGKIANESDTFEWKQADKRYSDQSRKEHEKKKITQHKPLLNKSSGGEGRPPKKK